MAGAKARQPVANTQLAIAHKSQTLDPGCCPRSLGHSSPLRSWRLSILSSGSAYLDLVEGSHPGSVVPNPPAFDHHPGPLPGTHRKT